MVRQHITSPRDEDYDMDKMVMVANNIQDEEDLLNDRGLQF